MISIELEEKRLKSLLDKTAILMRNNSDVSNHMLKEIATLRYQFLLKLNELLQFKYTKK